MSKIYLTQTGPARPELGEPSEREHEVIDSALKHASLMSLDRLETTLFVSFAQRVFWSGKVEGMDVALRMVQKREEEETPSDNSQN